MRQALLDYWMKQIDEELDHWRVNVSLERYIKKLDLWDVGFAMKQYLKKHEDALHELFGDMYDDVFFEGIYMIYKKEEDKLIRYAENQLER